MEAKPAPVRRRHVFYISGFDPRGPSHYHALYRDEAARQSGVSGMHIEAGLRHNAGTGSASWTVDAAEQGDKVETHYEFLRWDDIAREHWIRSGPRMVWTTLRTTSGALVNGALWRMFKLSWPPAAALVSPGLLLLLALPAAALLAAAARSAAGWKLAVAAGVCAVAALAGGAIWRRWHMGWLMGSHAFTASQSERWSAGLAQRLDAWSGAIAAAAQDPANDEVLVVAHSSGTILGVSALSRALQKLDAPAACHGSLSFLTLGQCLPMLSTRPEAQWFRDELKHVAHCGALAWIDFSAPPDGCCFALVSPLSPQAGGQAGEGPKLLSPRFAAMFAPADYAAVRKDRFRLHFQYIMSAPIADAYDYFAITAGSRTLAERFAHLPSVAGFNTLKPFR